MSFLVDSSPNRKPIALTVRVNCMHICPLLNPTRVASSTSRDRTRTPLTDSLSEGDPLNSLLVHGSQLHRG